MVDPPTYQEMADLLKTAEAAQFLEAQKGGVYTVPVYAERLGAIARALLLTMKAPLPDGTAYAKVILPLQLPAPPAATFVTKFEVIFEPHPDGGLQGRIQNTTISDINVTAMIILFLTHLYRAARTPAEFRELLSFIEYDQALDGHPWVTLGPETKTVTLNPKENLS